MFILVTSRPSINQNFNDLFHLQALVYKYESFQFRTKQQ